MLSSLEPPCPALEPGSRRTGKVARLPKPVRDQLNQMLRDGLTYNQILLALGDQARDLNEDCLSTWRLGGYQDWLRQQQRVDQQQATYEIALDLVSQDSGFTIQKAARQLIAAQICQLLLDFDPTAVAVHLAEKPEAYTRLINALARLSEGESTTSYRLAQESQIQARIEREKPKDPPKAITQETLLAIARQLRLLPAAHPAEPQSAPDHSGPFRSNPE